jgi:kynurenine 3-monooxygenase
MKKEITIIGAGLVGSLLSIYLSKRGYRVSIYERRSDMRKNSLSAGRSINLALSDRGIKALAEVGILEDIRKISIPMHGRQLHHVDGTEAYQAYGKEGQYINAVSRGELNRKLMDLAEAHNVKIFFQHRCENINWKTNEISFSNLETNETVTTKQDLIFGSDGAFSAARMAHQLQHDRFQYQQYYIDFGYKELTIPAGPNGSFLLEKNALHIWPRGAFMMIALPNPTGDFTCTLFVPFEGEKSFNAIETREDVEKFFAEEFPDALPMMPTLLDDYFKNPTASLVTVRCYPWVKKDKLALMGDAAHAIVPFYGQGMNCSFEDVVVMDECIEKYGSDWNKIFEEYQKLRKPNADAISQLAIQNYTEMAEKVGDQHFMHKKHIEHDLSDLYPTKFKSQYELTTFSLSPYKYALDQGVKNDLLLEKIIADKAEDKIKDPAYMEGLWHLLT